MVAAAGIGDGAGEQTTPGAERSGGFRKFKREQPWGEPSLRELAPKGAGEAQWPAVLATGAIKVISFDSTRFAFAKRHNDILHQHPTFGRRRIQNARVFSAQQHERHFRTAKALA